MTVSPPPNSPAAKKLRRRASAQGFSLAEAILSVAITSSSLLAVIGMLTGTLGVARESKEETVSGVLLRQLAGEIKDLQAQADSLPTQPPAGNSNQAKQPVIVLVDESMKILEHSRFGSEGVMAKYQSGTSAKSASAFARIDRMTDPQNPLMDRVLIRVESPASAPASGRSVRSYAALSPKG